ncbi:MAG: YitT family protein, partial [Oscillospiraceae bacterium]|nr:YitT family protein [Oscillospiraceae bacterium]
FGNVKIVFDISCVVTALLLSLIFFDFTIVGTREGTVISALLTGVIVKFFCGKLSRPVNALLT